MRKTSGETDISVGDIKYLDKIYNITFSCQFYFSEQRMNPLIMMDSRKCSGHI